MKGSLVARTRRHIVDGRRRAQKEGRERERIPVLFNPLEEKLGGGGWRKEANTERN